MSVYNPEGCKKVAGGHSEAATAGHPIDGLFASRRDARLWNEPTPFLRPLLGLDSFSFASGGLRFAGTTGYYLERLRRKERPWATRKFSPTS